MVLGGVDYHNIQQKIMEFDETKKKEIKRIKKSPKLAKETFFAQ
jgi:hypothetical protein